MNGSPAIAPANKQPQSIHTWELQNLEDRWKQQMSILAQIEQLSRIPDSQNEREWLGEELWWYVLHSFAAGLSGKKAQGLFEELRSTKGPIAPEKAALRKMQRRLDRYLVENQWPFWGWRLLLSRHGLELLARVELFDTDLAETFAKAVVSRSKWLQGQTGRWRKIDVRTKKKYLEAIVPDLQMLFPRVKAYYNQQPETPELPHVIEFVRREVSSRPLDYKCLYSNLLGILRFIEQLGRSRFIVVVNTPRGATQFANELLAKAHGYSPKTWKDMR